MATSSEIPDAIGFSGADPQGLGTRVGGADKTRPVGISAVVDLKQAIVDQVNPAVIHKQNLGKTAATQAGSPPPDMREIMARLARLEAMLCDGESSAMPYALPGLGHNARFIGGKLELNLIPDEQGSGGGGFTPRVIIFDYGMSDSGGPVMADVVTAIQLAYNDWGAPYDGSNPLTPQAFDFLACDGLNYLVFTDQNFFGTIGAEGYSIIFFVVGGITYTAFSVGGAWANGDGF